MCVLVPFVHFEILFQIPLEILAPFICFFTVCCDVIILCQKIIYTRFCWRLRVLKKNNSNIKFYNQFLCSSWRLNWSWSRVTRLSESAGAGLIQSWLFYLPQTCISSNGSLKFPWGKAPSLIIRVQPKNRCVPQHLPPLCCLQSVSSWWFCRFWPAVKRVVCQTYCGNHFQSGVYESPCLNSELVSLTCRIQLLMFKLCS